MNDSDYNSPTITLKRGKTEIQIKNAAAVIKRVDEMFPKTSYYSWNPIKEGRERSDAEKTRQREWMNSAQEWFRQEFCGGTDNQFEVIVDDGSRPTVVVYHPENHTVSTPVGTVTPEFVEDLSKAVEKVIPSTDRNSNDNTRWDILQKSIEFLKWKTEFGQNPNVVPDNSRLPTSENVLDVAQKFAGFVEGKQ